MDVFNDRYNPNGKVDAQNMIIDYELVDMVCLFSVFTHMYELEIRHYLSQIYSCLKTKGICLATFFIFDDERIEVINSKEDAINMKYQINRYTRYFNPDDKLHAISFHKDHIEEICKEAGFTITEIVYGDWAGGNTGFYQDYVVLQKD